MRLILSFDISVNDEDVEKLGGIERLHDELVEEAVHGGFGSRQLSIIVHGSKCVEKESNKRQYKGFHNKKRK